MHDRLIGPFFFMERTITGNIYLDMLEQYVFPQLDQIEEENNVQLLFQQDGAPPHFSLQVRARLNDKFPDRWIGRAAPIPWPPRSPDLTPLYVFVWGYVNNIVYSEKIRDLQHLRHRITSADATITPDMIQRTWGEIDYRLDVCRTTNGTHIETY